MSKMSHNRKQAEASRAPHPPQQKQSQGAAKGGGVDSHKLAPRIQNRRAYFDYSILDKLEVGIELVGSEVKSVRKGQVQMAGSFARIRNGEVQLMATHIEEYIEANQLNHDPTRTRRLLLHKREIRRLGQSLAKNQGATLIPLEFYFRRGFVKVLLGLAIGKKQFDKRASIKEREDKRNIAKVMKQNR